MNYIFATPFSITAGELEICSWTDYSGDMQHNNDTSCITTTILGTDKFDDPKSNKEILTITDLLGKETLPKNNTLLFYIYDDGTVEKRIIIE